MNEITKKQVAEWIPVRDKNTYKNKMGHILCVGGNAQMGGAIILSSSAALNAGSGLVTVASAPENLHALHARLPETMFQNMYEDEGLIEQVRNADVVVLGPGLGKDSKALHVFETVLKTLHKDQCLILDADGLFHFSKSTTKINTSINLRQVILTPHLGEWSTLSNIEAPADDINENQVAVNKLGTILILKKARTEIYFEDEVWKNTAGNPTMATGGMGDTLTGILASFLGQFPDRKQAILSAVYVHSAVADDLAETHYVTLPSHLIANLPIFMKKLTNFQ